jgi:putative spermidine/putrescine transport system ATP-binding protein
VRNLSKVYDKARVVSDVSFRVEPGRFLTLLGPSGSGKTTILRMIAGFTDPTEGQIEIQGRNLGQTPPHKRNIGVVFQHYALFPHLTVFQNVAYPLQMRGTPKDEISERVGRSLDLVRLGGFQKRFPKQLSGGQQQRVALARAIVFEPSVLLMDEPLGALDKRLRETMQVEIRELQEKLGITTISVTHDQIEALVMSDTIVILDNGILQQIGSPNDVYRCPQNRFVADFIGESNFFAGRVTRHEEGNCELETPGGMLIQALSSDPAAGDKEVHAVVRPESIQIGEASKDLDNAFQGTIQEIVYLGDVVKYFISLGHGERVTAKLLAGQNPAALSVGATLRVGWNKSDCLVVH